ncbi:hypothetical protein IMZ48_33980 [Candidatus Bathyarchaeota archaeon]|nr:hypothetical protein [Candidatus Bathyarchaeota archaeon]
MVLHGVGSCGTSAQFPGAPTTGRERAADWFAPLCGRAPDPAWTLSFARSCIPHISNEQTRRARSPPLPCCAASPPRGVRSCPAADAKTNEHRGPLALPLQVTSPARPGLLPNTSGVSV